MNEADIYRLIKTLAGGNVFPYVVPLNAAGTPAVKSPWVVFSIPSSVYGDTLCALAENKVSVQIDVYSSLIDEAQAIRNEALAKFIAMGIAEVSKRPGYDADTRLHRATLEFSIIK